MSANVTSSWNASTWHATTRQGQVSLKKNIQAYKAIETRLNTKLDQLREKKTELAGSAFIVVDDATPTPRPQVDREVRELHLNSPTTTPPEISRFEENRYHHNNQSSLAAAVTDILIESVEIRLNFIKEAIALLTQLYRENPKQRTPPEYQPSRYEEWVQTNQRLFELNSHLYDLEKVKFDLQRREETDSARVLDREDVEHTTSQLVHSNALKIQSFLSRHQFPSHTSTTTQIYLQEVLTQRGDRTTLEAQKVQEYVNECMHNSRAELESVIGAHPDNYQQFMAVLCNFMVERQRELQGEHLPHSMVYSTVEQVVVPQVQTHILRYIQQAERDARIREQCDKFSAVTLQQLNVRPAFRSAELEPFVDSISQLRATYFSTTPTDKMSRVVAAAKALYDQLSKMGEDSIDGDSFLDLWVYVIIKANIPDLATNIEFMILYGNPALGMDEAGYYLTTLSVAANFIEIRLAEQDLKKPNHPERFVLCERERFLQLSKLTGSCFEVETERAELRGYKVAVVKDWVLNRARLFCSVLVPTDDDKDVATVSVIRLSSDDSSVPREEYFAKKLTQPQLDLAGLATQATPLGEAVALDMKYTDDSCYFVLDGGDYEQSAPQIQHMVQLIRLGSETSEKACDSSQDQGFVYVPSPSHEGPSQPHDQQYSEEESVYSANSTSVLTAKPEGSKVRSVSSSEIPPSISSLHSSPSRSISHSPYLVNYTALGDVVGLDSLPPGTPPAPQPPSQEGAGGQGERKLTKWKLGRKRTLSLKTSSRGLPDLDAPPPPTHLNIPQVNISSSSEISPSASSETTMITPTTSSSSSNSHLNGSTKQRRAAKTTGGREYRKLHSHYDDDSRSTTSDIYHTGEGSDGDFAKERFAKSENLSLFPPEGELDKSRSPSLRRLRDGLFSHFTFKRRHSSKKGHKKGDLSQRSTLMVPFLAESERGEDVRSKVRSKTSGSLDFPEHAERGRSETKGSFVMVMLETPGPGGFLDRGFLRKLEENFRLNHMFGSLTVEVEESMENIVRQGQMFLQHLNYLSLAVQMDGVFSHLTLLAVRQFQAAHNKHSSTKSYASSLALSEDGYLTPVTFQYLRQAFLTVYASMLRLGFLSSLGEEFDPTSTRASDVSALRGCVQEVQDSYGLTCGHKGVLCQHTIAFIRDLLRGTKQRRHTEL